uniref:FTH domain-containing protein n=1 Tax=Caenorhabditis tropicalis TaxID=1561998 RepID=A0A1I7TAK2_9PELO
MQFNLVFNNDDRLFSEEELRNLGKNGLVNEAIKSTNEKIRHMENAILPFKNRKNNIRPDFEIHLSMKKRCSDACVIERVKYTGDIHKAAKSLMDFMFTKRQHIPQVNEFSIPEGCPIPALPAQKMRIKHLDLQRKVPKLLELMKPIIDESSFPMEKMTIFFNIQDIQKIDYEFIKNVKLLVIQGTEHLTHSFILKLQNKKVHFDHFLEHFLESQGFVSLIENWVAIRKPIGTCFTFFYYYLNEWRVSLILNHVRVKIEGAIAGDKCVDISMSNSTVLKVSYELYRERHYLLKMAVVSVE